MVPRRVCMPSSRSHKNSKTFRPTRSLRRSPTRSRRVGYADARGQSAGRQMERDVKKERISALEALNFAEGQPSVILRGPRGADGLLDALRALDLRLAAATEIVKLLFGPGAARDLFRGLHITPADADRALSRPAVAPLFGPLGFN